MHNHRLLRGKLPVPQIRRIPSVNWNFNAEIAMDSATVIGPETFSHCKDEPSQGNSSLQIHIRYTKLTTSEPRASTFHELPFPADTMPSLYPNTTTISLEHT